MATQHTLSEASTQRALRRFFAEKNIRFEDLQGIRWRVHVVCPFNQDRPQKILITRHPHSVTKDYALCFDSVRAPRLEEVVKAVPPVVGIEVEQTGRFIKFEPKSPGSAKAKNGRVVIGPGSIFLDEPTGFLSSAKSGRELYRTIRARLGALCEFLPRNLDLQKAFCRLLDACACQHQLPAYTTYGPLAPGLRERLTELLWSDDDSAELQLGGVDFDKRPWSDLAGNVEGQRELTKVAHALRDALHDRPERQHGSEMFGPKSLDDLAREVLATEPGLAAGFQKAWAAARQLRQVLRDKTLIMRILHWVLSAFYDLDEVKAERCASADKRKRDSIVEALILEGRPGVVAPPVQRPGEKDRRRLGQELTKAFDQLLTAILADDEQRAAETAKLPEQVRPVVESVRADPVRLDALRAMTGLRLGGSAGDQLRAFRESWRILILDVLLPVLCQEPVLTVDELTRSLIHRTQLAFLLALFLNRSNKDTLRTIGERHRSELAESMKDGLNDENLQGLLRHVLEDVILEVASPEKAHEIERQLTVVVGVMPAIYAPNPAGIPVSALVPVLNAGEVGRQQVKQNIGQRVRVAVENETGDDVGRPQVVPPPIEERLAQRRAEGDEREQLVRTVAADLCTSAAPDAVAFRTQVADELGLCGSVMQLVFARYVENRDKAGFVGQVDRLVLESLMLQDQANLGLGDVSASLFMLLADLVAHLDPEHPDPRAFLRDHSLLEYFKKEQLEDGGVTELRQTLETSGLEGLGALLRFVGEVLGLEALLKIVDQHGGEIVLHNATATEYLDLLEADNLAENAPHARGLLRPDALADPRVSSPTTIPILTYLTDTAFPEGDSSRLEFLQRLATMPLCSKVGRVVLPPICMSTGPMDADGAWVKTGQDLAKAAERVPAPVLVVGPSPWCLSRDGASLPTYVPAGYRVCAWLLGERDTTTVLRNVPDESRGRFRVIGHGCPTLAESLELVLHGRGDGDHSFAADIWLYHQLLILAAATAREGGKVPDTGTFFSWLREDEFTLRDYDTTAAMLAPVLLDPTWRFSFGEDIARGAPLATVRSRKDDSLTINAGFSWFNQARKRLGL